jgi:SAM-dependent methyltransferase
MFNYPTDLYQCLVCGQEELLQADDRIYCSQCGQVYPFLTERGVDFSGAQGAHTLSAAQAIAHTPIFAWGYERLWRPWALTVLTGESFESSREATLLMNLIQDQNPILDLGTAAGYWSRLVLQKDPQRTIIGLDNSSPVLLEAAHHSQPDWIYYSLLRAQAEQLPLRTGSFGAVMSGASLNELPLDPCLTEISRILKPGGVFVSMHSQPVSGAGQILQQILQMSGLQFPGAQDLEQRLQAVGLQLKSYLSFGWIAFIQAVKTDPIQVKG